MGTPVFILSGGDPVKRPDLFDLIRHGKQLGLRMGTIPAATRRSPRTWCAQLKDAGLDQMALSLDFPRAELHDAFRGVPGAFAKTMEAVEWAHRHELPLQINTTVCGRSAPYLEEMAELVEGLGIVFWEVFFLVPMGRGEALGGLTAGAVRGALRDPLPRAEAARPSSSRSPRRRTTGATSRSARPRQPRPPPVRRLPQLLQRSEGPGPHRRPRAARRQRRQRLRVRVAHRRDLPERLPADLASATCATQPLADIYRDSPLFRDAARPRRAARPLRPLRVPRHLRRLALARLRAHRQLSGHRPVVRLPATTRRQRSLGRVAAPTPAGLS